MILGLNVTPSEGEVSVKCYETTMLYSRYLKLHMKGYVEITTKRLLYQSIGKRGDSYNVIHKEIPISEISDIQGNLGSFFSFNLPKFMGGLFLSAIVGAGIALLINRDLGNYIGLIVFAYGGYLSYQWANKESSAFFSMNINTKSGNAGINLSASSNQNSKASLVNNMLFSLIPGSDSDLIIREIGAVIQDVQTLGDFAVEKWKPKE